MKKINFIKYLNEEADYKPQCHRCGYSNHVWDIDDEWICSECLTPEERYLIVKYIEKLLI